MSELTQSEYYKLFKQDKVIKDSKRIILPGKQENIRLKAISTFNKKYTYTLDIGNAHIALKYKFQKRRQGVIFARIEFEGSSHKNPEYIIDKVPSGIDPNIKSLMKKYSEELFLKKDHIHIYVEGYYDKWAFPLHEIIDYDFNNSNERINYKNKMALFLNYCNIKYKGIIDVPLNM